MPKRDEINRLLQLAGVPLRDSDFLATEKLADLLDGQEEVSHAAKGGYQGAPGVLITTDSRLLFAGLPIGKKSRSDLKVVSAPYEKVEAIEYGRNFLGGGAISIVAGGIKSAFACDAKQAKSIAEHIHVRSSNASPLVAGKLPKTSPAVKIVAYVLVAVVGLNLLSIMLSDNKPASTQAQAVQQQEPVKRQIAKKDGTFDARPNDLDELCKDWVYLKAKAVKYSQEGNLEEAQKTNVEYKKVNVWLAQYRDEDVARVCQQYDTRENQIQYMR